MKNQSISDVLQLKINRFIKASTVFIFICVFHASAIPYAKEQRVSIQIINGAFYDVVTQIEKQSEFMFFYKSEEIDNNQLITFEATNKLVPEILDEVLKAHELSYHINDRHIIITKNGSPPIVTQQRGRQISGTVLDRQGEPIIGANIIEKGTTNGVISDIDGKFTLTVQENAILQISYIGFIQQEIRVANQSTINVTMGEDTQNLDEVVVVGYGTQARKDISSSITTVSAENLKEVPVATFAEALMGQAAGVFISSTGAPGSPTTIRIRGVGSVNAGAAGPLIIVDGISNVSIDAINPNDIENFSILKDASATAIYGARGANGVILITTKQGSKEGRVRVTYDGYVGLSTMANDGYDVLNGWEAMEFQARGMVNKRDIRGLNPGKHAQFGTLDANDQLTMPYATKPAGFSKDQIIQQYGSVENWVNSYRPDGANSWARSAYYQMLEDGYSEAEARKGSDWYDLIVQKGLIQNHNLAIQGGNGDKGMYSVSLGVSQQEGTIKASYFDRYTLRANLNYNPSKFVSFGFNINLMAAENAGDRGGNGDGTPFGRTMTMQSWVPMYNVGGDFGGSQSPEGGRNVTPLYTVYAQTLSTNRNFRGQASVFAELKPIAGLTIRTQYAPSLNGGWSNTFSPITIMHNKEGVSNNQFQENADYSMSWQWTNTVNYNKTFNEDHSLAVTAGAEAIDDNRIGRDITATRINYAFENDPNTWIINNGSSANMSNEGTMETHTTLFGYFGRAEYSYKGTYILNASIRRDASSRFSQQNRWGTFPSVSAAWRVSDEAFMLPTKAYIDDLKFRVGFGTTGNSNTGNENAYNYAFPYGTGNTFLYARTGTNTTVQQGFGVTALGDVNAKWETVRTLNLGVDVTAFKQKLTASVEWYTRQTTDMLVQANWSALAGDATRPRINIGDMNNKGVDLTLGWRDRTKLFSYNISANISTYRNKITKLGSSDIFTNTRLNNISITTEGQPIAMFYGYNVIGIYKSEDDVLNYKSNGQTVLPFAAPSREKYDPKNYIGRYIIEDVDGNGIINASDRTIIGNPHPDFSGGLNASISYRNFDLSTAFYFSVGNDMYKHYMYYTHYGALQANYSKDRRDNSWHPVDNPNGKYPLWLTSVNEGDEAGNHSNSMYVEDGSYLRMRTLTLGYSLPRNLLKLTSLEKVRIYAQISNVFTLTNYSGLEPEVRTSSELNRGVDYGSYGMPRQFILGVNISFQ